MKNLAEMSMDEVTNTTGLKKITRKKYFLRNILDSTLIIVCKMLKNNFSNFIMKKNTIYNSFKITS